MKAKKEKYVVVSPYPCPRVKRWTKVDDEVEYFRSEAEFLFSSGKIKRKATETKSIQVNKDN